MLAEGRSARPSVVLPRLLLGNGNCAQSARALRQTKVTHVLNVSSGVLPNYFEKGRPLKLTMGEDTHGSNPEGAEGGRNLELEYGAVSLDETLAPGGADSKAALDKAADFIKQSLATTGADPAVVLVHCNQGEYCAQRPELSSAVQFDNRHRSSRPTRPSNVQSFLWWRDDRELFDVVAGVSQGPAAVLAYLMRTEGVELGAALARLSKRRFVRLSPGLLAQLEKYRPPILAVEDTGAKNE